MSILNPLFEAVAWIIMQIHAGLGHIFGPDSGWAWGLSIVLLVVLLRLLMVPLFIKQVRSQRKMLAVAPQLQELRKRYKNDKQRLNEETMKFYKENGVNPLGGCLPMVAQFPVFISLFEVLRAIADWVPGHAPQYGLTTAVVESARHARVFGALLSDKVLFEHPAPPWSERSVILVAVVVSMTTTFITMRQSTKRGMMNATPDPDNPMAQSQKYMMYIAPFFALTGLYWQFGLVIYWVTNNLWTMSQQHFMYRGLPVVGATGAKGATAPAVGRGPGSGTKSVGAAKSGTATRAAGTAKAGSAAKATGSGNASKAGSAAATGNSAKTGSPAKAGSAAKTGTAAKSAASAKSGTAAGSSAKANGAKSDEGAKSDQGTKASEGTKTGNPKTDALANGKTGARGLLRVGRKAAPEPEPEPEPETKIVRQQPVRQSRSKRSGRR